MIINKIFKDIWVLPVLAMFFVQCQKDEYSLGDIKTPNGLTLTTQVAGVSATQPNGDGTGMVSITAAANDALSYKIDFGDGKSEIVPGGVVSHKYATPGTNSYTITVTAVGTAGALSTLSKKVNLFVAFEIPANIMQLLTGGSSKKWAIDKNAAGHFGVGPIDAFSPIWYAAGPNSREACAYDDELTFAKTGNTVTLSVDNKGQSFSTAAATGFYGFNGPDNCYGINAGPVKNLVFMNATSGSNSSNSTGIQFEVPGNGILSFGTGGTVYEILSITNTSMMVRSIGADGNSWYQIFKSE